jgi:hypothetical protein
MDQTVKCAFINILRLTSGDKNVLLFYLSAVESEGVFVCPPNFSTSDCSSSMKHVIDNFHHSCMHIHNLLQHSIAFKVFALAPYFS